MGTLPPFSVSAAKTKPALEMTNPRGLPSAARGFRDSSPALAQVFQDAEVTFTDRKAQQEA